MKRNKCSKGENKIEYHGKIPFGHFISTTSNRNPKFFTKPRQEISGRLSGNHICALFSENMTNCMPRSASSVIRTCPEGKERVCQEKDVKATKQALEACGRRRGGTRGLWRKAQNTILE